MAQFDVGPPTTVDKTELNGQMKVLRGGNVSFHSAVMFPSKL